MSPARSRRTVGRPLATRADSTHAPPVLIRDPRALPSGATVLDVFERALRELFVVRNPQMPRQGRATEKAWRDFFASHQNVAVWVYYPWRNLAVRTLPEELYFELRTARNRNLITEQEQRAYRDTVVGIAGLSVGSSVLSALVMSGGPKVVKVADFDTVALSNLNRIRATLLDVGMNKTVVAARSVWELDPFATVRAWERGLNPSNIRSFVLGKPKADIFIDEMDNLELKIAARFICKEHRLPVIMATDNGNGVIVDVERFDLEPKRPLFHGSVGDLRPQALRNLNRQQWLRLAVKIIGPRFMTPRHQESLLEVGKSLAGVPQLGTTAFMAGAAVSFVVRRIANGDRMPSGRYLVGLEDVFIPGYGSARARRSRTKQTRAFEQRLTR